MPAHLRPCYGRGDRAAVLCVHGQLLHVLTAGVGAERRVDSGKSCLQRQPEISARVAWRTAHRLRHVTSAVLSSLWRAKVDVVHTAWGDVRAAMMHEYPTAHASSARPARILMHAPPSLRARQIRPPWCASCRGGRVPRCPPGPGASPAHAPLRPPPRRRPNACGGPPSPAPRGTAPCGQGDRRSARLGSRGDCAEGGTSQHGGKSAGALCVQDTHPTARVAPPPG